MSVSLKCVQLLVTATLGRAWRSAPHTRLSKMFSVLYCNQTHGFCSCAAQQWIALVYQPLHPPSSAFLINFFVGHLFTRWPWQLFNCIPSIYTWSNMDGVTLLLSLAVQSCWERIGWWSKVVIVAERLAAIFCRICILGVLSKANIVVRVFEYRLASSALLQLLFHPSSCGFSLS